LIEQPAYSPTDKARMIDLLVQLDVYRVTNGIVRRHRTPTPRWAWLWANRATSDDEAYRVVGLTERTASGPVRVFAAASLEAVSDSMTGLQIELAVGLPLVLALVALTSW
jgi:hypothetical protein